MLISHSQTTYNLSAYQKKINTFYQELTASLLAGVILQAEVSHLWENYNRHEARRESLLLISQEQKIRDVLHTEILELSHSPTSSSPKQSKRVTTHLLKKKKAYL